MMKTFDRLDSDTLGEIVLVILSILILVGVFAGWFDGSAAP